MLLSKVCHCHQSFSQDFSCGHAASMFHLRVVFFTPDLWKHMKLFQYVNIVL